MEAVAEYPSRQGRLFQSPLFDIYGIYCLSFGLLSRDGSLDVAFLCSDKYQRQHNILCIPIKYNNIIDIPTIHDIAIGLLALDEMIGKSCYTIDSKSCSCERSMFSCHLRYEHISHSIWLISLRANMPWPMIDWDLLEAIGCPLWSMGHPSVDKGLSLYLQWVAHMSRRATRRLIMGCPSACYGSPKYRRRATLILTVGCPYLEVGCPSYQCGPPYNQET